MKALKCAAFAVLISAMMAGFIGAQETQVRDSEGTAPNDTRSALSEKFSAKEGGVGQTEAVSSVQYPFTALSGIGLDDMSSGTTQLIAGGTDNENSILSPIGFLFRFGGTNYTDFGANGNGVIRLGITSSDPSSANSTGGQSGPKIMPYWDDLCVGNGGKVHYKTTGVPGSRKLIVEWRDMKITKGTGCNGVGGGNFQMWLFEGSGAIQFVYGSGMIAAAGSDGGYSVGIAKSSTDFASVTTVTNSVSYSSINDVQISAIAEGRSYLFSPVVPAAPTGGNITELAQTSLRLNWTDNANNETGYIVRRSLDGVNYTLIGLLDANSTTAPISGLTPGTQYFFKVNAVGDGALSADLDFSATTNPTRNISSVAGVGFWEAPGTWVGGSVPTDGDNVTISDGSTVIIDTLGRTVSNLTVGNSGLREGREMEKVAVVPATLVFSSTFRSLLTVTQNVTINPNGVFTSGTAGTITDHSLTVGGDLTNNGILDFSTNNDTAGAKIFFQGASSNTFGGNGPTTDIRDLQVDKGTSTTNILEVALLNFTVRGSASNGPGSNYLTLKNGTFKISGTFTGNYETFFVSFGDYQIAQTAGFWLNNPNYTVAGRAGSPGVKGLLRITAGTFNVGTQNGDSLLLFQDSIVKVEGGNINTTGRLSAENVAARINYYQTGGTVTTCTIGHFSTSFACFDMGGWLSTGGNILLSGGDIVIQNATQIASGPRDYRHWASSDTPAAPTATTLHFGNGLTTSGSVFHGLGKMPNVDIGSGQTLAILQHDFVFNSARGMNIGPGATFDIGNDSFSLEGANFVNNGTLVANASQADLFLGSNLDVVFSGSGVSAGIVTRLTLSCHSLTLNQANSIRVRNILIYSGDIINAGKLTIGNNDTQVNTVTFGWLGGSGLTGGSFDSAPAFDLGAGGESVYYLRTAGPQTTGPEINPSRTLVEFTYDDATSLTITGGDLTVTNTLNLSNGQVITGENTLTSMNTLARNQGYVNGALRLRIPSTGFLNYPIGQNGIYLPISASVNSIGVVPSYVSIRPIDGTLPGLLPSTSASRYWRVEETGDVAMTIGFKYDDVDVNGNEANYLTWRSNGGSPVLVPGSGANPSGNVVSTAFGITDLTGDWGVGAQADPGPVSISGRITTSSGNPIRNASLKISGGNLPAPVTVFTGSLGTYSFSGLQAGEVYTVQVSAKRYRFTPATQQVTPFANVASVDFAANPQEEF